MKGPNDPSHWGWHSQAGWEDVETAALAFDGGEAVRYVDDHHLAVGGMGRIDVVHDTRLRRRVVRKTLRVDLRDRDSALQRLVREAQVTARLEHPGIVPVYDAGRTDDGQLFYTMRLMRGRSLEQALSECPDVEARLRYLPEVRAACQAVAYAHSVGVVHRDLKPANILVGAFGETVVADWGLARVLDEDVGDEEALSIEVGDGLTRIGQSVGTPGYMAPEQSRGEAVGPPADVFAMGRVLRCLLSGAPVGAEMEGPLDLQAIVTRATEPVADNRYADASALADDLGAWLDGRWVDAHRYSTTDFLLRVLRAWRAPIAVGTVGLAALVGVGGYASYQTAAERDRAVLAEQQQRKVAYDALVRSAWEAVAVDDTARASALARQALVLDDGPDARGVLAATDHGAAPSVVRRTPLPECASAFVLADDGSAVACLDRAPWFVELDPLSWPKSLGVTVSSVSFTGADWIVTEQGQLLTFHRRSDGEAVGLMFQVGISGALRPVGEDIVASVSHGRVELMSAWREEGSGFAQHDGYLRDAPADLLLRGVVDGIGDRATIGDVVKPPDGSAGRLVLHEHYDVDGTERVRWLPDGPLIGTVHGDVVRFRGQERMWAVPLGLGSITDLDVEPGGDRVLATGEQGRVRLLSIESGAILGSFPENPQQTAWLGRQTLRTIIDGEVVDWSVPRLRPVVHREAFGLGVVAIHPDGSRYVFGGDKDSLGVVEIGTGTVTRLDVPDDARRRQRSGAVKQLDWAPDRDHLYAALVQAPSVTGWDGESMSVAEPDVTLRMARTGAALADGWDFQAFYDGGYRLLREGALAFEDVRIVPSVGINTFYMRVARDPQGMRIVAADAHDRLYSLRVGEHDVVPLFDLPGVGALALVSEEGPLLAVVDGELVSIDLETGERERTASVGADVLSIAVDDAPGVVVTGHFDGSVRFWSYEDLALLGVVTAHQGRVPRVDVAPDGSWAASASWDGTVRVMSTAPLR